MREYTTTTPVAVGVGREIILKVTPLIFTVLFFIPPLPGQNALSHSNFCSVSPFPEPRAFTQPDGTEFEAMIYGGLPLFYLETTDGYTILKDPSDGYFKYAVKGLDGDLYITNIKVSPVGRKTEAEKMISRQISQHLRYTGKALSDKLGTFNQAMTNAAGTPPAVFPPTGNRKALLILIKFPDQANSYPKADFQNLTNQEGYNVNGQTGSFRDYYQDISYGNLNIDTDVFGWYTAINNRATYGNSGGSLAAIPLIRQAVDAAEAQGVNFANYDGDGDGKVDVVMVIHSGRGAEESGNGADIWSHRWVLSADNKQVTYDGKYINDYIVQPEKFGPTDISNIGVLCHEFGHALGLPDLYDTDGSSRGIGKWCLMAGGTWNNSGKTPAHMSAWCKKELGWINPTVLTGIGNISNLNSIDAVAQGYQLNTPVSSEYFLLENRQKTGWDTYLPGHGLTIYHIDESKTNNKDENRYLVNLEQADGSNDLNNDTNSGDNGDPYPGNSNKHSFNCFSTPNSENYGGTASNVSISAIGESNGLVNFNYGLCQTCDGTPEVTNTVSDISASCSGGDVNLSLAQTEWVEGTTFQWQTSSNGSSFSNISGANESTHQTILLDNTWYRCKVTCQYSGLSSYSTSKKIDLITGDECYCDATAENLNYEKISKIEFNDINNSSSSTAGYEDFTFITTNVLRGNSYAFTATIFNPFSQDQILVWIDFNADGDFSDSGELVFTSAISAGPHSTNISIPTSATIGPTRMRVRLHDSGLGANSSSCGTSDYGQVEDYTIQINSPNSGNCEDLMTLVSPKDDITNGTTKNEVNLQLFAKNQVMGGQLTLDAGVSVELQPGFSVMAGAELTVQIDGCGNQ